MSANSVPLSRFRIRPMTVSAPATQISILFGIVTISSAIAWLAPICLMENVRNALRIPVMQSIIKTIANAHAIPPKITFGILRWGNVSVTLGFLTTEKVAFRAARTKAMPFSMSSLMTPANAMRRACLVGVLKS